MKRISLFLHKTGQVRSSQESVPSSPDIVEGIPVRSSASSWEIHIKDDADQRAVLAANIKLAEKARKDWSSTAGYLEKYHESLRSQLVVNNEEEG